jgi:hypothetical protein
MKIIVLLFLISLSFAFRLNPEALKKRGINVEQIVSTVGVVTQAIDNGKVALHDNKLENGAQTFLENLGQALSNFGTTGNEEVGDMNDGGDVGDDDGENEDGDEFFGIDARKAFGYAKEISHALHNNQLEAGLQTFLENLGKDLGNFGSTGNGDIGDMDDGNDGDDVGSDDKFVKINTRKTFKAARKIYQILHDNELENNAQKFLENLGQSLANYGTPDTSNFGDVEDGGDVGDDFLEVKTQTTTKKHFRQRKCRGIRRIFRIVRKIAKFIKRLESGNGQDNRQFRRRFLNNLKGGQGQNNKKFGRRFLKNLLGLQGQGNRQRRNFF